MKFKVLDRNEFMDRIPEIMELYSQCFSGGLSETYWRWRYLDNPMDEILISVAIDCGKIVAFYAASPQYIYFKGEKIKAGLSLNTMTSPDYRGQGLLIKTAKLLYQYMQKKEYKLVWGFPNYISNSTFTNKLGWEDIYEIPTMTLKLQNKGNVEEVRLCEDNEFQLEYQDNNHIFEDKIRVIKDTTYFRWRYLENPSHQYINYVIKKDLQVEANVIFKEYQEKINIVDIKFKTLEEAGTLLKAIKYYAQMKGKESITVWASINTELHYLLEKMHFKNEYPITYVAGKILNYKISAEDLFMYKKWIIQAGDDNVY